MFSCVRSCNGIKFSFQANCTKTVHIPRYKFASITENLKINMFLFGKLIGSKIELFLKHSMHSDRFKYSKDVNEISKSWLFLFLQEETIFNRTCFLSVSTPLGSIIEFDL